MGGLLRGPSSERAAVWHTMRPCLRIYVHAPRLCQGARLARPAAARCGGAALGSELQDWFPTPRLVPNTAARSEKRSAHEGQSTHPDLCGAIAATAAA